MVGHMTFISVFFKQQLLCMHLISSCAPVQVSSVHESMWCFAFRRALTIL